MGGYQQVALGLGHGNAGESHQGLACGDMTAKADMALYNLGLDAWCDLAGGVSIEPDLPPGLRSLWGNWGLKGVKSLPPRIPGTVALFVIQMNTVFLFMTVFILMLIFMAMFIAVVSL